MSDANVTVESLARAAYAALNAADREAFLSLVSEDVEFTSMVAEAEGSVFRGHAGVLAWWKRVPDAFEHVTWEVLGVREYAADRGVVKLRMSGRLAGVDLSQVMWMAAGMRDGRVIWWAFYRTNAEAQEALEQRGAAERGEATHQP
jgi:ketosteroid isomerase-like protein